MFWNQQRNHLMVELIDRFGELPIAVENLFKLIEIKILCIESNINYVEFGQKGILFSFYKNQPNNPKKLLKLGFSNKKNIIIRSDQKVFFDFNVVKKEDTFILVKKIINLIS